MTISDLNALLADRKTTKSLLEQWARLRWAPLEADGLAKRLADVVYRPLAHVSERDRFSQGTLAAVMVEARAKTHSPDVRDWRDAIAIDTSSAHRDIIRRIEELVAPFEDIVRDEVTA